MSGLVDGFNGLMGVHVQLINPSTHQPVNPSTHQPVNPSTRQPVNPSTHQPVNPSTHQPIKRNISGIEERVISMYAKGMSSRAISSHFHDIYGHELFAETISTITYKVIGIYLEGSKSCLGCTFTRASRQSIS
jgi:hypothetical protein